MKNAGQKFIYLCKISSTKFDSESNWNILNEKRRQNFLHLCKISSTKFELESNCNFLNEKGRSEIPSKFPQRNSIWNQIETFWMKNAGQNFLHLCKISSTKFDLESDSNFLNKIAGQNFLYLCKIYSTNFDLKSNCNFLDEKRRPKFPISLQKFVNEIWFRIKLKHSEWKTQARISYIFAKFTQRKSI